MRCGTIRAAATEEDLCAARRFAQVEYINILKTDILVAGNEVTTDKRTREEVTTVEVTTNEVTGAAVTGESVMWKPASISLAATLFLFLLF